MASSRRTKAKYIVRLYLDKQRDVKHTRYCMHVLVMVCVHRAGTVSGITFSLLSSPLLCGFHGQSPASVKPKPEPSPARPPHQYQSTFMNRYNLCRNKGDKRDWGLCKRQGQLGPKVYSCNTERWPGPGPGPGPRPGVAAHAWNPALNRLRANGHESQVSLDHAVSPRQTWATE